MSDFIDLTKYDEDEEIYWTDGAVCPYCGFLHVPDCESDEFYRDGDYEWTCENCDKVFKMETYISYNYTTSKISECEGNNEHS